MIAFLIRRLKDNYDPYFHDIYIAVPYQSQITFSQLPPLNPTNATHLDTSQEPGKPIPQMHAH
jgi:hypothetical protein